MGGVTVKQITAGGNLNLKNNTMNEISNNQKTVNEANNPRLRVGDVSSWPILYGFKKFATPRIGLFSIHKKDGNYLLPGGWENEIKEYLIIGEDNTSFVYKLKPTEQEKWVGDKTIKEQFILPIGIHKSRLIKWTTGQLELF